MAHSARDTGKRLDDLEKRVKALEGGKKPAAKKPAAKKPADK